MIVARLPLDERDPRRRLERVVEETRAVKQSHQALGMQTLEELSDHTFTTLLTQFARLAARAQPYNLVVTNVPGPQFPVYVEGARMIACHPLVPLFREPGARRRALQLRRPPRMGVQRRLGRAARSPRSRGGGRRGVRAAAGRRERRHPGGIERCCDVGW